MSPSGDITAVGIGEYSVAEGSGKLVVYGLGSCVALILFDPFRQKGGLAHILLPGAPAAGESNSDLPAKYSSDALRLLLEGVGVSPCIRAAIVGGARLFLSDGTSDKSVGERNVKALKEEIQDRGIELCCEDTGGGSGRTVSFELPACFIKVRTLREDWKVLFPPNKEGAAPDASGGE